MPIRHHSILWPGPQEELLLHAALSVGEAAISAWQNWQGAAKWDQVEAGTFRLLPLLYWNLQQQGITDPQLVICKGIYRQTWYKNQRAFQQFAVLIQRLQEAGIPTLLLHDAAVSILYYRNPGLRPVAHLDLQVPTTQIQPASQLLRVLGWLPHSGPSTRLTKERRPSYNQRFSKAGELALVLHPCAALGRYQTQLVEDHWQSAIPLTLHRVDTLTVTPADQLLHLCTHELDTPYRLTATQWVADAMLLLRSPTLTLDWGHLQAQAQARAQVLRVQQTLTYLQQRWDAPIPAAVLQGLGQAPIHDFERIEAALLSHSGEAAASFVLLWTKHQRQRWCRHQGGEQLGPTFRQQLQDRFALDHGWQIPLYVGAAALQRLTQHIIPRKEKGNEFTVHADTH